MAELSRPDVIDGVSAFSTTPAFYAFERQLKGLLGLRARVGGAEYMFTSLDDRDNATIRAQGQAPATNPFILTNASGTDLRRTDAFELHAFKVGLNVRF